MAKKVVNYVVTDDFDMRTIAPSGKRAERKYKAGDEFQVPDNWVPDPEFVENLKRPRPAFRETYVVEYRGEDGRLRTEETYRRVMVPIKKAPPNA